MNFALEHWWKRYQKLTKLLSEFRKELHDSSLGDDTKKLFNEMSDEHLVEHLLGSAKNSLGIKGES